MQAINEYSRAIVDILRNLVISSEPERLDEFNEEVNDIMEFVDDNEEFRDDLLLSWGEVIGDRFGLCEYGIHVEVAKQHPELKKQAKDIIKYEIAMPNSDDWLQRDVFRRDWGDDVYNIENETDQFVEIYSQLREWEEYFGTKFCLSDFNAAVAYHIKTTTDLGLPRDEDIIRLLPKEVFSMICDFRQYTPTNDKEDIEDQEDVER